MSKQLREMLNKISEKKEAAKVLVSENKVEEAKAAMVEIKELQTKATMLAELEEEEEEEVVDKVKEVHAKGKMTVAKAFVECVKAMATKKKAPSQALETLNLVTSMTEGVLEDGGLTVPEDVRTTIKELRRATDSLETIVNVETVSTEKGSRVIEKNADMVPWDNVDEEADFPDVQGPQFENIAYQVKKKGGILKLTRELLADTAENIMTFLNRWIAKKSKVTRNFLILKAIQDNFGIAVPVVDVDDLKDIFNVSLDPALTQGAKVVTNQQGFNFLDKLKIDGKYALQVDPVEATKRRLFGLYEVMVLSDKTMPSVLGKAPIYCGNFSEAITLFDREHMTIETSDQAGDMWKKDQVGVKVRERLDVKVVDAEAIIKGEITI